MNRKPHPATSHTAGTEAKTVKPAARPAKAARDEVRRDEIVAAARACVVRHGFHAASMAQIAEEARMSVSQIYRYFDNKAAIVFAIVECIVSERLAWIASTGRQGDLAQMLSSRMFSENATQVENRALLLEVTAEATRNPEVAEIVRKADHRLHVQALATVRMDGGPRVRRAADHRQGVTTADLFACFLKPLRGLAAVLLAGADQRPCGRIRHGTRRWRHVWS